MMPRMPRPTLLVFTLGPEAEAQRHPLLPEALRGEETRLRQACLASVVAAGRAAGCRVLICSPMPLGAAGADLWSRQVGADFGERFRRGLETAEGLGGPVVAVGADVPGLSAAHLRRALEAVASDPDGVVVGPSLDGGFYLVAGARPLSGLVGAVRWCGPDTRRTLLAALRAAGRAVRLLEALGDLDAPADLERWVASGPAPSVDLAGGRRRLIRILAERRRPDDRSDRPRPSAAPAPRRGRAPPLAPSA